MKKGCGVFFGSLCAGVVIGGVGYYFFGDFSLGVIASISIVGQEIVDAIHHLKD